MLLGGVVASLGCVSARMRLPVRPPPGLIFESFSAPVETNFEVTPVGGRVGTAHAHFVGDPIFTGLPIITWGQADESSAAADAGITTIHYVDYEVLSVLGIYARLTVKVSGD